MVDDKNKDPVECHELEGPVLLLAGPGTGKTYRLIQRIKFLVEKLKTDPNNITVITFTTAAAANMRMRISDKENPDLFVPTNLQPSTICTMHSLGHRIISEKATDLGLSTPIAVVWSDFTRNVLIEDAAQLAGFQRTDAKKTADCRQFGDCRPEDKKKCIICDHYKKLLRACNAVDHDDQILLACEILADDEKLRSKFRKKAGDLLIDEYQDINAGQFKLIKCLTEGQLEGLFAVGDDDQSIYSWRGGSPEFIRNFENHFGKKAGVYPLSHSYRCHKKLLEGALAIVKNYDKDRRTKGKFSYEQIDGPEIVIHSVPSDKREAVIVRKIIEEALPSNQVLVLVPRRTYASLLITKLRQAKIEYIAPESVPGEGLPTIERLATWLNDEDDSIALRECIDSMLNSKVLGVPSKRVRRDDKKAQREEAFSKVSGLWDFVLSEGCSLWKSLEANYKQDKLLASIYEVFENIQSVDEQNVPEFLSLAATNLEPWKKTDSLREEIITWVNKYRTSSGVGSSGSVKIMTLEGAKGLEAAVVCVIGVEEGTIPGSAASNRDMAEWSRLMYVSMTRVKKELHLFHARKRSGAVSFQQPDYRSGSYTLSPSCFLDVIPDDFVERKYYKAKT